MAPSDAASSAGDDCLPVPLTSLLGRDDEISTISGFLLRPDVRLLTLTGSGGVGKSRLALAVAAALADHFPDGTRFVSLASLADPQLVLPTVAQALGVREHGARGGADTLAAFLRDRSALLILDNFEHVLAAAPAVAGLLEASPGLTVLVTSRERLRLSGEREFPVSPLPLPDRTCPATRAGLAGFAAIQLFVTRAAAVAPEFALTDANVAAVAEICRRLDGLPLAIELAAARSKVLPPEAMLARLEPRLPLLIGGTRNAPARLQTMRDAIAWSHDLLSPEEQTLFRSLAVFAGGCTLEAAEAVAAPTGAVGAGSPPDGSVLDLIDSLVDKSLLRPVFPGPRFTMLETVREFALERLAASRDEDTIRRRHATWCLTIAEEVEAEALAGGWERSLVRMEPEYDNLRAALGWATRRRGEATDTGLRLACALWLFWFQRGHLNEGVRWFERAFAASGKQTTSLSGKAMLGLAGLAGAQGDWDRAEAAGEECLALYQALDDRLGVSRALHLLGSTALQQGDLARAVACLERAVAGYAGDEGGQVWLAMATAELGVAVYWLDDHQQARLHLERAATIRQELGDRWPASFTLPTYAAIVAQAGRGEENVVNDPARHLSPREREVLRLIAAGRSNAEIAHQLFISPRTASTHAANILHKLGLGTRAEAIAFAHQHGLL